ncbi:MAG TPA: ATP-binding protein [Bacilli bacterium]
MPLNSHDESDTFLRKLTTLLQKNRNCAVAIHRDGTLIAANAAFFAETGLTQNDLPGKRLQQIASLPDNVRKCLDAAQPCRNASGNNLTLLASARQSVSEFSLLPINVENRDIYIVTLYDLDQQYAQNLLQQFAGNFMRDVNLGVVLIDTNFKLVNISDMACQIFAVNRSDVIGKNLEEVFSFIPDEHRFIQKAILDGKVARNVAVPWANNNKRYELLMDSNLLKDDDGQIVGAYIIFKDVTNLRSLEEQVQRSDRLAMIGQIAAGTAHEIRNPLTSIKGFLQVLKKSLEQKEMHKEYNFTEIMLSEINRINDLVSEFLLLSKPRNVSFGQIDLSVVIVDILPIINNEAILYGVDVQYQPQFKKPKVLADRELLKQVFLNICKNGIEAMKQGGTLTITEKHDAEGKNIIVEIHDTGPGIPAYLVDKIFDPFFTTKETGTGLGLSVCQRIIHDIGGTISVSSKGKGAVFTIAIPYVEK